jgi:hypothetical protein
MPNPWNNYQFDYVVPLPAIQNLEIKRVLASWATAITGGMDYSSTIAKQNPSNAFVDCSKLL